MAEEKREKEENKNKNNTKIYEFQVRRFRKTNKVYENIINAVFGESRAEIFFKKNNEYVYVGFVVFSTGSYFNGVMANGVFSCWLESGGFLKYREVFDRDLFNVFLLTVKERQRGIPWHHLTWFFFRKYSNEFPGVGLDVCGECYTLYFSADKNYSNKEEKIVIDKIGEDVYKKELGGIRRVEQAKIAMFLKKRQERHKKHILNFLSQDIIASDLIKRLDSDKMKKEFCDTEREYKKIKDKTLNKTKQKIFNFTDFWKWSKTKGVNIPHVMFYNDPPLFEARRSNTILCLGCNFNETEIKKLILNFNVEFCYDTKNFWNKFFTDSNFLDYESLLGTKKEIKIPCAIISSSYIKNYTYLGSETLYIEERIKDICKNWQIPFCLLK